MKLEFIYRRDKSRPYIKICMGLIYQTLFIGLFFLAPQTIFAQTFNSDSYKIQWGNFNMTSGRKTSTNYTLTDTVGQNAPGQFDSDGYTLKSGAQYAYESTYGFSFQIDNLDLYFGYLTPNYASTQSNTITISSPAGHGYQVLVNEDHTLSSFGTNSTIPDTTCDAGTCSESVSGVWTQTSSYGFGFNATGLDDGGNPTGIGTSGIFANNSYFRQFANAKNNESNQIIMEETVPVKSRSAKITYRIVIGPNQPGGTYQNSINFIAVPKY
jgi:hypothetical protein